MKFPPFPRGFLFDIVCWVLSVFFVSVLFSFLFGYRLDTVFERIEAIEADGVECVRQREIQSESFTSTRTAPGKRSAGAVRADAMLFGVQGGASTPALPVPVGNTGTEFDSGVVYA